MQNIETIYIEHVDKVYKFFYVKCLSKSQAEDLTSQTFMAYLEHTAKETIDNHTKYLYGIMRNIWVDFLREKYAHQVVPYDHIEDFEDHVLEQNQQFDTVTVKDNATNLINRLPDKQKEVAHKRLIEEMTLDEIAQHLNKTKRHVRTTQNRAIKNLKKMLNEPLSAQEAYNA